MAPSVESTLNKLDKGQLVDLVIHFQEEVAAQQENYRSDIEAQHKLIWEQREEIKEQSKQIQKLMPLVEAQKEEIESLKRRLSHLERDSNTSSKPPSSDIKSRKVFGLREKTGKKPGGQKGHLGYHRSQVKDPNEIIPCMPTSHCQNCGKSLNHEKAVVKETRQEIDIPEIKPMVTEYQKMIVKCSCGTINKGLFPSSVRAHVQIGQRMKSFLVYLNIVQLIPYQRLSSVCTDLLGFNLCKRSIENSLEEAKKNSEPIYDDIMAMLKASPWIGSDETSKKVKGKKWWEWVWQNNIASYYAVEDSRGYKAVQTHFGENYKGVLLHDCYSAQNNTKAKSGHQLCLVHLMRDLKYLIETYDSKWAQDVLTLFKEAQRIRPIIWDSTFPEYMRNIVIQKYENMRDQLFIQKDKNKDVLKIQKRLLRHKEKI